MGGISGNQYVRSSAITRDQFEAQLKEQGVKGEKLTSALNIFDRYAKLNTNDTDVDKDKLLDEQEQLAARAKFDALDTDGDGEVEKKEYKNGDIKEDRKAYKAFMEALSTITSKAGENGIGGERGVIIQDEASEHGYTIVKGATTSATDDDTVVDYTTEEVPDERQEESIVQDNTPVTVEPAFKDTASAKQAIYQYFLGNINNQDIVSGIEAKRGDETLNNPLEELEIGTVPENGTDEVEITYKGKKYILKKDGDNYNIFEKLEDGTTSAPKSLREVILNQETTDTHHNYRNRHGAQGNNKSTYKYDDNITNSSQNRRHVNPVQTFTSMLLNNDETSTLAIDNGLKGEAIINVILADKADASAQKEKGISMGDLLRYIWASVAEAKTTTENRQNYGVRSAAGDVDLDLKDINNIGIIFKKFDENNDGYLNASELDKLISKYIQDKKSTTTIAKESYTPETPPVKTEPVKPTKPTPQPVIQPHTGQPLEPNRTRHLAGTNKNPNQDVSYHYENGLRTLVENVDGQNRAVLDENIAEYTDHGLFGAGEKDFVRIKGLPANVRAEIVSGKLQNDMRVKVEDANGDVKYYTVKYDGAKKTYTLGNEVTKKGTEYSEGTSPTDKKNTQLLTNLFGANNIQGMKVPQGLTVETKHKKTTYKLNGREIKPDVARAYVIKHNKKLNAETTTKPTHLNMPTDNNIQTTSQPVIKPKRLTDEELQEYLKNDSMYQSYKNHLAGLSGRMNKIETKYGFSRGDVYGPATISNIEESKQYQDDSLQFSIDSKQFKNYSEVMATWQDGRKINFVRHGTITYTNVETITLTNGQHAYKSDQGFFYPYIDGSIGGPQISNDSELIPSKHRLNLIST